MMPERAVVGWDIGGAHVKAALLRHGRVADAAQWPCPLWQGLDRLDAALDAAHLRWPDLLRHAHAVTMTGEMVDLFAHREDGVTRLAALLARRLPEPLLLRQRRCLARRIHSRRALAADRIGQLARHRAPHGAGVRRPRGPADRHRQHHHRPDRVPPRPRPGHQPQRLRTAADRRAGVPGRGAHAAVRAGAGASPGAVSP